MFSRISTYNEGNLQTLGLAFLRFYLGIGLFIRGIVFIQDPNLVTGLLTQTGWAGMFLLSHYVALAHLVGGPLLSLGLGTRVAAIVQIPPLVGAVFLIHLNDGLFSSGQSLEFSALVLFMLAVFSTVGHGAYSLDAVIAKRSALEHNKVATSIGVT